MGDGVERFYAELADDLVQDTLVRALRSEHLFHGGEVRSWLYTILTNLNRNRLRSLARRPPLSVIGDDDAPAPAASDTGSRDIEAPPCSSWCSKG
jgi:RNA polymerase sigma-70 factor (ECF subfamily)